MTPDPKIALLIFGLLVLIAWIIGKRQAWIRLFYKPEDKIKTQVEDILKQLYHVEYGGKKATLNAMAGALKMKHSKLVHLIEHMTQLEFIKVDHDHIHLTDLGKDYALRIIRIHRLWEKYLSEKTGIHKSEWHERAEKMEHNLSAEETDELYRKLGSPRFDPHGDPIPLKSGEIIDTENSPLSSIEPDTIVRITHIEDEPEVIYEQIIDEKLHIGQHLKVTSSDEQKIGFTSEGHDYTLSSIVASNIGVKKLSSKEVFEEQMIRLSALRQGEKAKIMGISRECRGANRRRLLDLGFIKGTTIETGLEGPMAEPKAFLVKNTLIALRNDQADLILIEKENDA